MKLQGFKANTHEGFCSWSMLHAHFARVSTHEGARGSVYKFAQFAPGACSQIFNRLNIVEHFAGWKFCSRRWSIPMFISKANSFITSLHCHELLVWMQIPGVLFLRHAIVFLCSLPRKVLVLSYDSQVCVSDIAIYCRDLWCALHRWSCELIAKKTGNCLYFFGMHHRKKFDN